MCEVVDRSEAELNQESVMLSAKWVITNKGTVECPKPKVRLVAREFASDAIDRDTLFSGTPGLSIARSLISRAATLRSSGKKIQGTISPKMITDLTRCRFIVLDLI